MSDSQERVWLDNSAITDETTWTKKQVLNELNELGHPRLTSLTSVMIFKSKAITTGMASYRLKVLEKKTQMSLRMRASTMGEIDRDGQPNLSQKSGRVGIGRPDLSQISGRVGISHPDLFKIFEVSREKMGFT